MTGDDSGHMKWGGGFYCHVQNAGFEPQELERNDGDCPWCGRSVDTDTTRSGGSKSQ